MLRGDRVKDDSGSYVVFTEQGSSASQRTAAKVMDVVARLPDCAGQAAGAVSARTQGPTLKTQRFLLSEICTVTHLQASCGKDSSRKFCWSLDGIKYRTENVFLVHRKSRIIPNGIRG